MLANTKAMISPSADYTPLMLPLAGAKGAVGLSLYSTATVARFAPAVARAIGAKLEEWRVADKYVVVKTVVVEQAKKGFSLVASGARSDEVADERRRR